MDSKDRRAEERLILPHGGYRKLLSFQMAQLCYDLTVRFVELYIDPYSRTKDQMVQAARSGVQNIAEGSQASATSKKTELKLTNVARASLEELRLDYEDYLRQKGLVLLAADSPELLRFKKLRCQTMQQFRDWLVQERTPGTDGHELSQTGTDKDTKMNKSFSASVRKCASVKVEVLSSDTLAANGILSLLNLACHLLNKQIAAQAAAFESEGGFTERLYKVRSANRNKQS